MKMEPYKVKSEIYFESNEKSTGINVTVLFECNGLKCENCDGYICHQTSDIKYAKRFGLDE